MVGVFREVWGFKVTGGWGEMDYGIRFIYVGFGCGFF